MNETVVGVGPRRAVSLDMRILLWHGWLLTGSGSNVYTANIARSWRKSGHEVLVLCQDRKAAELSFVDAAGDLTPDNLSFDVAPTGAPSSEGTCTVVRPDLGGLLPVFVYDAYEGFEVKRFIELTDEELENYVRRNVDALVTATERFAPDAIITGHEVMGPEIARRAAERTGHPYVSYLHGSGLEYAVKLQERYKGFSLSGLHAAARVAGGSNYMLAAAGSEIPGEWQPRASVVNPGCDIELFQRQERTRPEIPTVAFVGKLIASKGVHNFLAALGLVEQRLAAVVVGYGGFESPLHQLAAALKAGDLETARRMAEEGDGTPLSELAAFLEAVLPGYAGRMSTVSVEFTGRLEHGPLAQTLPSFDVLVVPSVLPEAFGMVAAEAAACGVLPIVPDHSGIGEAGAAIEEALGAPGLLTFDPSDPVRGIAAAIDRVLGIPFKERQEMGRIASQLAAERWSWQEVGTQILALAGAQGRATA